VLVHKNLLATFELQMGCQWVGNILKKISLPVLLKRNLTSKSASFLCFEVVGIVRAYSIGIPTLLFEI